MTFCISMKVEEGLVALSDTRITSGVECITARKVSIYEHENHSLFLMTSGLRAARDKALTYFNEVLEERDDMFDKLYKAVNAFGEQVRRVVKEDQEALDESGLPFNLFSLIGGQLENDREHKLYLLYPQGNWVEVSQGTPYYAIGESAYGKPLLDRALTYKTNMRTALKIGYLAFDATSRAANDVDFPIDVVMYKKDTYKMMRHRFFRDDLQHIGKWWQGKIVQAIEELPESWMDDAIKKLQKVSNGT